MKSEDCTCQPIPAPEIIPESIRCRPLNPRDLIVKLIDLLEDPISTDHYERQFIFFNDFVESCKYGIWIQDIAYVIRLLELLTERLKNFCVYKDPVKKVLLLCSTPPFYTKTSDSYEFARDLQEYFSFLGFLMIRIDDEELQDLTIVVICNLLSKRAKSLPLCYASQKDCNAAVESSELPNVIAQLLEFVEENMYTKLLKIVKFLTKISSKVCKKMIEKRILNFLLIRLDPEWQTRNFNLKVEDKVEHIQHFVETNDILWNLLEALDDGQVQFHPDTIPNRQALWSLQYSLRSLTLEKRNEINRNQLMCIIVLLINKFPSMPLNKSGIVNDIMILSAATEIGAGATWAAQIKFTKSEENYEFKKMMLLTVCYCSTIPSVGSLLQPKRIVPALLKIITPELSNAWHPHNHSKLITLALHTICVLFERFKSEFIYCKGQIRLLMIIDYYNLIPYDLHMLRDSLKCFKMLVSTDENRLHSDIVINSGLTILNTLACKLLSSDVLTIMTQNCLAFAFAAMTKLCSSQNVSNDDSASLCMNFIDRVLSPNKEDPIFDPKFLICGIEFLWEVIVWNKSNLKMFVSMGGVYKLLDILQQSIFPVKLVALGALVDMCEEGTCIPHLITWRGKGMELLPMLLELFREENRKIGVKITESGAIANAETPIMGSQQWYETFFANKDPDSSPATIDLLGSCRPKIYAIIQLLTNRHEMRVSIANEHYCMFTTDNLSVNDQMTLLLAENFLALKLGETWVELNRDLELTGIRPLAIDQEVIGILTKRFYKWSLQLQTLQQRILNKEMENRLIAEKRLYYILKESRLIESLEALRDLDYIARTTEKMFRYLTKMKHMKNIERTRNFTEPAVGHTTYMNEPRVTPVFEQEVSIQSNIIIDPEENVCDIRPVSGDFSRTTFTYFEN